MEASSITAARQLNALTLAFLFLAPSALALVPLPGSVDAVPIPDSRPPGGFALTLPGVEGPTLVASPYPVVFFDGAREASLLAVPAAAGERIDPAALDVRALAREGLLAEDGALPVIVRGPASVAAHLRDATVHSALGLVSGRVTLAGLPALALLPGVERVFLDARAKVSLAESVPLIRADEVHERHDALGRSVVGTGVTIAILDTGIDHTHADLGGCLGPACKVKAGANFVGGSSSLDDHGHGTHVAATAAGAHGVAPGADLLAYKVCDAGGSCPYSAILSAVETAVAAGADVISMSLGGPGTSDGALAGAVDWAVAQGVVVVSAAGNDGYRGAFSVGEPAASLSGIAVGATDKDDRLAGFSSRGPVRSSAGAITGIKPDVLAPGVGIVAAVPPGPCALCSPSGQLGLSGTSMATPHVSGVAALLLQAHPGWSPADVKAALAATAKRLGLDARQEGEGRVDALAALDAGVVVLNANGWLGIVKPDHATFSPNLTLAARNLGASPANLSFASALTILPGPGTDGPVLVDGGADAARPWGNLSTGLPSPVRSHAEVRLTNLPTAPGREEGATFSLYAPGAGSPTANATAQPDGLHAGRLNASFHVELREPGVWRMVTPDGHEVRFQVGPADVPAGALSPSTLSLPPNATAHAQLDLALDNAQLADGWHELSLVATPEGGAPFATRASFLRSAILHLRLEGDPLAGIVFADGRLVTYLGFPGRNVEVLGPAGNYTVQVAFQGCPEGVTRCAWDMLRHVQAENVPVVSEATLTLAATSATHRGRVIAQTQDGRALDASALGWCNAGRTPACILSGSTRLAREGFPAWNSFHGWTAGQWFASFGPAWSIGMDAEILDGPDTYIAGNARRGADAPFDFVSSPATSLRHVVRYNLQEGASAGTRYGSCIDEQYGFGYPTALTPDAREAYHYGIPALAFLQMDAQSVYPVACQMLHQVVEGGAREHNSFSCLDARGCRMIGVSFFQVPTPGGFVQRRWFDDTRLYDDRHGRPDSDLLLFDGGAAFDGVVTASPDGASIAPGAQGLPFVPQGGGLQDIHQWSEPRTSWRAYRDGALVSEGPFQQGAWAYHGAGEVRLEVRFDGALLRGATGTLVHEVAYNSSIQQGAMPQVAWARVEGEPEPGVAGPGEFATRFPVGNPRTLRFALHDPQGQGFGPARVELRQGNQTRAYEDLLPQEGVYSVALDELGPGAHALRVEASTLDGRRTALAQAPAFHVAGFGAANLPPSVHVQRPQAGATLSGVTSFAGNASDPNGDWSVVAVEYALGAGAWQPASGAAAWSVRLDTETLPNGNHTLRLRASDGEAWSDEAIFPFEVRNNERPTVRIDAPEENATVRGPFTLSGVASDTEGTLQHIEVTDGRITWVVGGSASWSLGLDSRWFPGESVTLVARAYDGFRHSEPASRTLTLAQDRPAVVTLLEPAENASLMDLVTVRGTAYDPDGNETIHAILVSPDGGARWAWIPGGTEWSYTYNASRYPLGPTRILAYAQTEEAASPIVGVNVTYVTPPYPIVSISYPPRDAWVSGIVELRGNATQGGEPVDRVELNFDWGTTWLLANGTEAWNLTIDTATLPEGWTFFYARALSRGEESGWTDSAFFVDNHPNRPPAISIGSPQPGERVEGSVLVSGTTSDPDADREVWRVEVLVEGEWRLAQGTRPWTLELASHELPEGNVTLHARATDWDGATGEANVTFEHVLPASARVRIDAPAENATVSGLVNVSGVASASQNATLARVEWSLDGGNWSLAEGTDAWRFAFESAALPEGEALVRVRATDDANATALDTRRLVVQNHGPNAPPFVVIDAPEQNATVTGLFTVAGRAGDAEGNLTRVEWSLDGLNWTAAEGLESWQFEVNASQRPEGPLTLRVRAHDGAGETATATRTVHVRHPPNAAPRVAIHAPAFGDVVSGNVTFRGNATDPESDPLHVEVRIGEGSWIPAQGGASWNHTFDTRAHPEGQLVLRVRASDGRLLGTEEQVTVVVLNNRPPVLDILAPLENETLSGAFELSGTASDPDGNATLDRVEVSLDGHAWRLANGTSAWRFPFDAAGRPSGPLTFLVRAWDQEVSSSIETRTVNVLNHAPLVRILAPPANATVHGAVNVTGEARDADGETLLVEVRVGGGAWQPAQGFANWTFSFHTEGIADGLLLVEARAVDGAGEQGADARLVAVDNERPPTVSIESPEANATLTGPFTIRGSASDPNGDHTLAAVEWSLDGANWTPAEGTSSWSVHLNASALPAGPLVFHARARDAAETGETATRLYRVRHNAIPALEILEPSQGQPVRQVLTFRGSAHDADGPGPLVVEVRVGEGAWVPANGTTNWSHAFDTRAFPEGNLTLQARAHDGLDGSPVASVTVRVLNNRAPHVSISLPLAGATLSGAFAVNGNASDPDGDRTLQRVEVSLDGVEWLRAGGTAGWNTVLDSRAVANGDHLLRARASDGSLWSPEAQVPVRVFNNHAPIVGFTSPDEGATLREVVLLQGRAHDADGLDTIERVLVSLDGVNWTLANGTWNWSLPVDAKRLPAGNLTVRAQAFDVHGGASAPETRRFVVDPRPILPDLVVVNVTVTRRGEGPEGGPDDLREVRAVLMNAGEGWSNASHARGTARAATAGPASAPSREDLGEVAVPALAPGASVVVSFTWNAWGNAGDQRVEVVADSRGQVRESNETNNANAWSGHVGAPGAGGVVLPVASPLPAASPSLPQGFLPDVLPALPAGRWDAVRLLP